MEIYLEILTILPLFNTLEKETLENLISKNAFKIKNFKKNTLIHSDGEICNSLEIILNGVINIQKLDSNGNIITISSFTTRDLLGINLLFSSHPYYPMLVSSKTESSILSFSKSTIFNILENNPVFLSEFLNQISNKTLVLTGKINNIVFKTIRTSIIDFLKIEIALQKRKVIKLPFSKKEWAELLGIQRTSLFRELKKLKKEGYIEYNSSSIIIKKDLAHLD